MKIRAQILAIIGLFALAFIVLPSAASAQQTVKRDTKKARQMRDQADKAYRLKDYRDAIAKYSQAITFDPSNPDAHYWKGYAHQYLKEYDESITSLNKSLELGYKPIDVYRIRSYVNYERKDYQAAIVDIREIIKAEPNNAQTIRLSAEINYELKNYDEALASYQRLVSLAPDDANMYYYMARIYSGKGDIQNQESAAVTAIQKGTSFLSDALMLAADASLKQGKIQEAEKHLLAALSSKPDNPPVYRTLAEMYRSQSRFTDAIDITRRALRLYPNDGGFYTDISWYYSLAGRHQEAVESAQAGIRFHPDQYMAYTNLCRAYNDLARPDLAISACNGALRIKPDDGETYFYLARAYDLQNKTADATRYFKKAVTGLEAFTRENPSYSDAFYLLGNAYFADDQPAKAIEAYTKCLELSPNFARARYNMAMVHLSEKQKAPATAQYNILLRMDQVLAGKLKAQLDKLQ